MNEIRIGDCLQIMKALIDDYMALAGARGLRRRWRYRKQIEGLMNRSCQLLVNAQVSVNRAVFEANKEKPDATYLTWCIAEALESVSLAVKHAASRPPQCKFCHGSQPATLLCDFEIARTLGGKAITCDARVCVHCARSVGDKDFCPSHAK